MTEGFDVFVQLVIAAISTAPSFNVKLCPSADTFATPWALGFFTARSSEAFLTFEV